MDCPLNQSEVQPPLPSPEFADVKIILASGSPRRRELLAMILPEFTIARGLDVDETYPSDMPTAKVPEYLSQIKAKPYLETLKADELLITADTVVIVDDKILGKPHSYEEAVSMLQELSGRSHTVVTGVTLSSLSGCKTDTFSVATEVTFVSLTDDQIAQYVKRYKPMDKAGAYGVQEWIGAVGISALYGDYYNVMGLPVCELFSHLCKFYSV